MQMKIKKKSKIKKNSDYINCIPKLEGIDGSTC